MTFELVRLQPLRERLIHIGGAWRRTYTDAHLNALLQLLAWHSPLMLHPRCGELLPTATTAATLQPLRSNSRRQRTEWASGLPAAGTVRASRSGVSIPLASGCSEDQLLDVDTVTEHSWPTVANNMNEHTYQTIAHERKGRLMAVRQATAGQKS